MAARHSRLQLAGTIARLMSERQAEKLAKEIAAYLITERRTSELNSLMRDVAQVRQETYGVSEATVTTALPLADEVKHEIKAFLNTPNLILNEQRDAALIGGLRLEANDLLLDASVHSRLSKLKQLVSET